MFGYTPAGLHADPRAPPAPLRSVAIAAGSVFGSGGSDVETGGTGTGPFPPAHGSALIAATPRVRNALVPDVPQVVALWPANPEPSAPTAVLRPGVAPAAPEAPPPPP